MRFEFEIKRRHASRLPAEYREMMERRSPIEVRPVDPKDTFSREKRPPRQVCWMRAR